MTSGGSGSSTDVVIIGAGLAGLVAAIGLERNGLAVQVVEATHEVGGRTRTRTVAGMDRDVGAEIVGRHYTEFRSLAAQFGLVVQKAPMPRSVIVEDDLRPLVS